MSGYTLSSKINNNDNKHLQRYSLRVCWVEWSAEDRKHYESAEKEVLRRQTHYYGRYEAEDAIRYRWSESTALNGVALPQQQAFVAYVELGMPTPLAAVAVGDVAGTVDSLTTWREYRYEVVGNPNGG